MKNVTIQDIAEIENLELFETTSERNGYPRNLKHALKGFETFEQAQEIADKYDLEIQTFKKKDGWGLWYRTGGKAYEAFENGAEDYGDNYQEFSKMEEVDFIDQEIIPFIEDIESLERIEDILKIKKEIWEEIQDLDDDEIVITHLGCYWETIKQKSMYFYHDTNHYTIGLIF